MIVVLPWPPKELNPNAKNHWAVKAKVARQYKQDCFLLTKKALANGNDFLINEKEKFHLFIDFFPPDKRKRDDDNIAAAFKAGRDGIAQAIGVDDSLFISHPFLKNEIKKWGQVVVKITRAPKL